MDQFTENATPLGLYDPQFEHDACGIGAVVDIKGRKSHQTVSDALSIVERLEHRAGKDAEGKTGDGVGIMLQISHKFFSKVADELNISLGNEREYGVGMFFFPQNEHLRAQAMKLFELVTRKEGLEFLAWRRVPVDPDAVGQKARDCMPSIWQCFIKKPARVSKGIDFDRRLYIIRRVFEQASNGTYVPSLSSRTIVYKGMFLVHDLRLFYLDLQDEDYESAIGMVHSRFSTNTNPSWMRAHPNRFILHNGEINTIKGNTDAMLAREESIESPILQDDMNKILPIINTSGSDSAMLDNALEFMVMNGMDLPLAVMITIPERFLPVLRHHAGALGRPRCHPLLRRRRGGRGAGPQRSAPQPLLYHQGRPDDPVLRGGRAALRPRQHPDERPPAPRQNAAGGYRQGRGRG